LTFQAVFDFLLWQKSTRAQIRNDTGDKYAINKLFSAQLLHRNWEMHQLSVTLGLLFG